MFKLPQLRSVQGLLRGIGSRTLVSAARPQLPVAAPASTFSRFGYGTPETLQLPQSWRNQQTIKTISMLEMPKDAWAQQAEQENPVADNTVYMDSVKRKRRLKMKKHKLRKRRRLGRALLKRLGKVKD
ncbi:hypothetical protein C7M61_004617 [Candidozyma pseudohaemuli]|uniref:Small ribosomal subunit protein mS38 n=1 Tax=Candidozyma pseudohaemuli TaxID=418784 RepID=A0A2P7YHD0_9ASCO|nr:hypothetical protein C7M61_004617 [[Candida] pseudohaemulonii]PSK35372.1 hypothetical protein C7M61_004617 [[Candida] pseudohaemulonii]